MPTVIAENIPERLSRVETEITGIHSSLSGMSRSLDTIQNLVTQSNQPNWTVIIAGGTLMLAIVAGLWGVAISPVSKDVERSMHDAGKLSDAVLLQDERISKNEEHGVRDRVELENAVKELDELRTLGSPVTDKRLSVMEGRIENMAKDLAEIKVNGTPGADKRLGLLEFQFGVLARNGKP